MRVMTVVLMLVMSLTVALMIGMLVTCFVYTWSCLHFVTDVAM